MRSDISELSDADWTISGGRRDRRNQRVVSNGSLQSEVIDPHTSSSFFTCRELSNALASRYEAEVDGYGAEVDGVKIGQNFSNLGLYGRNQEIDTLRRCFEATKTTVASTPEQRAGHDLQIPPIITTPTSIFPRQLVLISGDSGTGKSSLAQSLREIVLKDAGFFASGKFDLHQSDVPYAGFAAAISELCQCLIEHKYNAGNPSWTFSYESIQSALHQELITDARALSMLVPSIHSIVSEDCIITSSRSKDSAYLEAKYRFNRSFLSFVQVVSKFGPLVVVLDDLQWADSASLDLLRTITTELNDTSACMIVGLYRSEAAADDSHPLTTTLADIRKAASSTSETKLGFSLTEIETGNLSVETIDHLLADLLNQFAKNTTQDIRPLAECIHKKTLGNAFFVTQFLRVLESQGLLYFDNETERWKWDIDTIKVETAATENVIELMNKKLRAMPEEIRKYMPLVASLGATFRMSLVKIVFDYFSENIDKEESESLTAEGFVRACEEEGIVRHVAGDLYQFEHDKMKKSALDLEEPQALRSLQFQLGHLLVDRLSNDDLDDNVYMVANLLDYSEFLADSDPRKVATAKVYLAAGKKAFRTSASLQASNYFRKGIELLPKSHFVSDYELSVDLFSSIAEANFCLGRFATMRTFCNHILEKEDMPLLDKRRIYNVMLNSICAEGRPNDARQLCTEILAQLGVHFPKVGRRLHTISSILGMKLSMKRSIPKIANLDLMSDDSQVWIMSLLDNLATYCYQTKQDLLPLVILKGLNFTMRNGLTIYTPIFLSTVALLCVIIEDFRGASLYCDQALKLLDNVEDTRDVEARTLFVAYQFVQHWQIPVEECLDPLLRAYQAGIASGDTESCGWCISCYLEIHFCRGHKLNSLIHDCRVYAAQLKSLKHVKIESFVRLLWQMTLDLNRSYSKNESFSDGDVVDKLELQAKILENSDEHWQASFDRYRLMDTFWAGNYEKVLALARETDFDKDAYAKNSPGTYGIVPLTFYIALAALIEAQETTTTWAESKHNFALGNKFTRKIQGWAGKGNPNVKHYEAILEAEIAAFKDQHLVAKKRYEAGIELCESRGIVNDQALAHERFAVFYTKHGHIRKAKMHVREAIRLYDSWGANFKSNQLNLKYFGSSTILPPIEIDARISSEQQTLTMLELAAN